MHTIEATRQTIADTCQRAALLFYNAIGRAPTEDETALLVKALVEYFTRPPALPSLDEMILDEAEADCEAASETLGRPLQEFEEDIVLAACARRFGVGCTKH